MSDEAGAPEPADPAPVSAPGDLPRTPPRRLPLDWMAASLRRERARAGLSLSELAKRAGIAKSTLSQLESAVGNPSMETIWALAVVLGVPFGALVEPPDHAVQVIRAGEGAVLHSEQSSYAATLLSVGPAGARRDLYRVAMEPGTVRASEPHIPGTVEHVVVAAGRVQAGPRGAEVELGPGDYLSFRGDLAHTYEALAAGTRFTLVMQHV